MREFADLVAWPKADCRGDFVANAVLTTKVRPAYDDLPESRYHFPATYLRVAQQAVGDWILYYEPRREDAAAGGRAGRQSYFAIARLERIEADLKKTNHHYAYMTDYLEFRRPVPFRLKGDYPESGLRKPDGSTNKGLAGRSVRLIPRQEFLAIVSLGFIEDSPTIVSESAAEPESAFRERVQRLESRVFRDPLFQAQVREAYDSTCAMTGLRLINGGGRAEIEAAHIRPVGDGHDGPDSPRNGIALSRTMHWMFDRGLISLTDDCRVLLAKEHVPEQARQMFAPDLRLAKLPSDPSRQPHPQFLRYHRDKLFKG